MYIQGESDIARSQIKALKRYIHWCDRTQDHTGDLNFEPEELFISL